MVEAQRPRGQSFEFEESARNGVFHGEGGLDAAGTTGTFAADHGLCLLTVGIGLEDLTQAALEDASNRRKRIAAGKHIAV